MSKAIEKGSFVRCEAHPEYGIGRVVAMEEMSTRVIFPEGGLRFFRAADMGRLSVVATPAKAEVDLLDAREREIADGTHRRLVPKNPEPPPVKAAAKRKAKPKKAAPTAEETGDEA